MLVLADFGSTFTKLVAVDANSGELLGRAQSITTIGTDLLDGFMAARERLASKVPEATSAEVLACSSAGGGLRVAVVGLEADLTAEAGRRVALNSGGRIVAVVCAPYDAAQRAAMAASRPDVVLLVGGTDGGNSDGLLAGAALVATNVPTAAVVVAGNASVAGRAAELLAGAGLDVTVADNVLPRIGTIVAEPTRRAIREQFIRHVIGGGRLSRSPLFADMVQMPTPDAVLRAVHLLAESAPALAAAILVDVGGATTDVYSVGGTESSGAERAVVPVLPARRTVEADLGIRWSAPGVVEAALAAGMIEGGRASRLAEAAERRCAEPGFLPLDGKDAAEDVELASLAAVLAVQRHAGTLELRLEPDGMSLHQHGPDLRAAGFLVASGGVFLTNGVSGLAEAVRGHFPRLQQTRHLVPTCLEVLADSAYLLAACGLLAGRDARAARTLLRTALPDLFSAEVSSHAI